MNDHEDLPRILMEGVDPAQCTYEEWLAVGMALHDSGQDDYAKIRAAGAGQLSDVKQLGSGSGHGPLFSRCYECGRDMGLYCLFKK